jgi:hypothetical protein
MTCYVICSTRLGCGQCLIWWWANFSGASSLLHTQWLSPRRQKLGRFAARSAPLLCYLWGLVYQAACPRLRACTCSMTRNLDIFGYIWIDDSLMKRSLNSGKTFQTERMHSGSGQMWTENVQRQIGVVAFWAWNVSTCQGPRAPEVQSQPRCSDFPSLTTVCLKIVYP